MKTYKAAPEALVEVIKKAGGRMPLVLQKQPSHFTLLSDPEDLRAWEQDVREHLGTAISATSESCTESGNPTNDCDTD